MKTILATLLASASLAGATTITINQASPQTLDFSVEWGASISWASTSATGPDGSTVGWWTQMSRNQNQYFISVDAFMGPAVTDFTAVFWSDPEYFGPVLTAYGSPNVRFMGANLPTILPLDTTPYGARFVFGAVPDGGATGWLLALALSGLCWHGRKM